MQPSSPYTSITQLFETKAVDAHHGGKKLHIGALTKAIENYLNSNEALYSLKNLKDLSKRLNQITLGEHDQRLPERLLLLKAQVELAKKKALFFSKMMKTHPKKASQALQHVQNINYLDYDKAVNLFYLELMKIELGTDTFEYLLGKLQNKNVILAGEARLPAKDLHGLRQLVQKHIAFDNAQALNELITSYDLDIIRAAIASVDDYNPMLFHFAINGQYLITHDLEQITKKCQELQEARNQAIERLKSSLGASFSNLLEVQLYIGTKPYSLLHYLIVTNPQYHAEILKDPIEPAFTQQIEQLLQTMKAHLKTSITENQIPIESNVSENDSDDADFDRRDFKLDPNDFGSNSDLDPHDFDSDEIN